MRVQTWEDGHDIDDSRQGGIGLSQRQAGRQYGKCRGIVTDNQDDLNLGRLKASVTVLEFVSRYVDLKPTASGAIGLCAFHDDRHPSFGVNKAGNYWHCFAGVVVGR